jgi:hypothetical protein
MPTPTPVPDPVPDLGRISSTYKYGPATVGKKTVTNTKGFLAILGNLKMQNSSAYLRFGTNYTTYLLYFNPGTRVTFTDNKYAVLSGFYTMKTGTSSLFDLSIYELVNGTYRVKSGNGKLTALTNAEAIALCEQRGVPLQ